MVSSYGRQWFNPRNGSSFDLDFLHADRLAMQGSTLQALSIYKALADHSPAARRRLAQAKRQAQSICAAPGLKDYIRVSHIDWYNGFSLSNPFITQIMSGLDVPWRESSLTESDLILAGCYGNKILQENSIIKDKFLLFISGENLYPSYDIHDFSVTTAPNSFCGKNIRYPQWYGEIAFQEEKTSLAYASRNFTSHHRDLLFSAIYNNSTPQREELICRLKESFGEESVHIFGSHRGAEVDKLAILARSRINVCFENSIGKGYCTEKLLHALSLGCGALYWGDPSFSTDFKATNVFNLYDSCIDNMLKWCHRRLSGSAPIAIRQPLSINEIAESAVTLQPIHSHIRKWVSMIGNFRHLLISDANRLD